MNSYTEIYDAIRWQLGRKSQDLSAAFLREMKAAQTRLELEPTRPDWMKEVTTLNAVAGAVEVTGIPADYLAPYKERALFYVTTEGYEKKLTRMACEEDIVNARRYRQDDQIFYYVHDRELLMLSESFDADTTLTLQYYAAEPELDGTIDNNWTQRQGEVIGWEAAIHIARGLRDDRKTQEFVELAQRARGRMFINIESDSQEDFDPNGDH